MRGRELDVAGPRDGARERLAVRGRCAGSWRPAITRVGDRIAPRSARSSASRSAAQQPRSLRAGFSPDEPSHPRDHLGRRPAELGREPALDDVEAETLLMPPSLTLLMRAFQLSAVPMRAAVLLSTSLSIREAAWAPSQIPIRPPMDRPQKWARATPSDVEQAQHVVASIASVHGSAASEVPPWPRCRNAARESSARAPSPAAPRSWVRAERVGQHEHWRRRRTLELVEHLQAGDLATRPRHEGVSSGALARTAAWRASTRSTSASAAPM